MKSLNLFSRGVLSGKVVRSRPPYKGDLLKSFKALVIGSFILVISSMGLPLFADSLALTNSEQRAVSGYDKVDIGGSFTVILVQGTTEGINIEAESEALKNIITKVDGSTLKIYTERNFHHSGDIILTISFINLKSIDCSGSIKLSSVGVLKFDKLKIESSGVSKTNLELNASNLEIEISGSGNATIKGSASDVELDISGSGKILASELNANNYEIDISGSGNAEINVSQNLDVSVSGTGTVKYKGEPKITQDISGIGKIEKI